MEKVDLHLHLDGSLSSEVVMTLAKEAGIEVETSTLFDRLSVPSGCTSLLEYLKCFDLPVRLLQTEYALTYATRDLVMRMGRMKLTYGEIRFAPQLHTRKGLSQQRVVEAVLKGVQEGLAASPTTEIGVLLCMMVTGTLLENQETAALSQAYLGRGVVGLDLAGAEGAVPLTVFQPLFESAYQADVPFTIHAGECGSYENVATAISFGARRIGHGCGAAFSESCMELIKREQVVLEMCPTSNIQTKAVTSITQHPIRQFFDRGMLVTVNTDNMTVSSTSLDLEYGLLKSALGFTDEEIAQMNETARKAAF